MSVSVRLPLDITLDRERLVPLVDQLYQSIRGRIRDGRWQPGTRIPATRVMATDLNVSRNTVTEAIERLVQEGYLQARRGSGTFIAKDLPDAFFTASVSTMRETAEQGDTEPERVSRFARALGHSYRNSASGNQLFKPGVPALKEFPYRLWSRLYNRYAGYGNEQFKGFDCIQGYQPLREALSQYLVESRALVCEPEQVIITAGAQQALDLAARLLVDPGDTVVLEEPGYVGARKAMLGVGADIKPIEVDQNGLCVEQLRSLPQAPKLICVTPAHQYPLGAMLSMERRRQLLEYARQHKVMLIEDDYDSEYYFSRRPLASLQGLSQGEQVFYMGSFSKVLFPALRLGYLVVPKNWVPWFVEAKEFCSGESPLLEQAVCAAFLQEGHFQRHLKRMRLLYQKRYETLVESYQRWLQPYGELLHGGAGMHAVLRFHKAITDWQVVAAMHEAGINGAALSPYYMDTPEQGLVLGFTNAPESEIDEAVARLAAVIEAEG